MQQNTSVLHILHKQRMKKIRKQKLIIEFIYAFQSLVRFDCGTINSNNFSGQQCATDIEIKMFPVK